MDLPIFWPVGLVQRRNISDLGTDTNVRKLLFKRARFPLDNRHTAISPALDKKRETPNCHRGERQGRSLNARGKKPVI